MSREEHFYHGTEGRREVGQWDGHEGRAVEEARAKEIIP